jgi:hypothetical protein
MLVSAVMETLGVWLLPKVKLWKAGIPKKADNVEGGWGWVDGVDIKTYQNVKQVNMEQIIFKDFSTCL